MSTTPRCRPPPRRIPPSLAVHLLRNATCTPDWSEKPPVGSYLSGHDIIVTVDTIEPDHFLGPDHAALLWLWTGTHWRAFAVATYRGENDDPLVLGVIFSALTSEDPIAALLPWARSE